MIELMKLEFGQDGGMGRHGNSGGAPALLSSKEATVVSVK